MECSRGDDGPSPLNASEGFDQSKLPILLQQPFFLWTKIMICFQVAKANQRGGNVVKILWVWTSSHNLFFNVLINCRITVLSIRV